MLANNIQKHGWDSSQNLIYKCRVIAGIFQNPMEINTQQANDILKDVDDFERLSNEYFKFVRSVMKPLSSTKSNYYLILYRTSDSISLTEVLSYSNYESWIEGNKNNPSRTMINSYSFEDFHEASMFTMMDVDLSTIKL